MRYLEARALAEKQGTAPENKMKTGTRSDQRGELRRSNPTPDPSANVRDDARKLAQEMGVELRGIKGSGSNGMILPKDVRAAAKTMTVVKDEPAKADGEGKPGDGEKQD